MTPKCCIVVLLLLTTWVDMENFMLFSITSSIDYLGLCIALWLAFYLLARGFPSSITLRTVVVLLALATFFFSASINLRLQIPGATTIRAVLLVVGLTTLHDLTNKLLPQEIQKKNNRFVGAIYLLGLITIVLLFYGRNTFVNEMSNILYVGRMSLGPIYVVYGILQLITSVAILNNFRLGARVGVGTQNRFFLVASILAMSTVGYGILALALTPPMPRVVQDALMLGSISVLGVSVARYQSLIERRTTLQDFPISFLAVLSLSAIFAILSWIWSSSPVIVILVTALAILTHAIYDLAREFLNRLQYKNESDFRRQLRQLEHHSTEDLSLHDRLLDGLILLCQIINTSGGFVAVRENKHFVVSASHHSFRLGSKIPSGDLICEELCHPAAQSLKSIDWIAPAFESGEQVAVIGILPPKAKIQYSPDDLDLLVEAADRIGTIVYLQGDRHAEVGQKPGTGDSPSHESDLRAKSDELITTLVNNPDPEFVKIVEEGLRNLADVVNLGQSPLTTYLRTNHATQIERGKAVQQHLNRAIEMLKPEKPRPPEPLPREWYSYVVLHDAYVEDVPNREIMARLYISEGTFNRSRRHALRGVARFLLEEARKM
jgi:hypothetical protein